jgi:hypothetical protein
MRLWLGWGECLINILPPYLREAVKGTRCVGSGIDTHEMRGTRSSGRVAGAGGEVGAGGVGHGSTFESRNTACRQCATAIHFYKPRAPISSLSCDIVCGT